MSPSLLLLLNSALSPSSPASPLLSEARPDVAQTRQVAPSLTPTEKLYGLSLFWKEASDHFAYFDRVPGLDWDKAYQEAISRVLATNSTFEYYRELKRFSALLKDGHTNVFSPAGVEATPASPGVAVAAIGKRAYVVNVVEPLREKVPIGSEIVALGGTPLGEHLERDVLPYISSSTEHILWRDAIRPILWGPGEGSAEFSIITPKGERRDVSVARKRYAGAEWSIKRKDDLALSPGPVPYAEMGDGIIYVALNSFNEMKIAEAFAALVPKVATAKGLILDLRANGGGSSGVASRIVRNFTTGTFHGFGWRTREVRSSFRAWGRGVDAKARNLNPFDRLTLSHYNGTAWYKGQPGLYRGLPDAKLLMPKVVLIGNDTFSAAEDMLVFLSEIPSVKTVGQRTAGSTGQPYTFALPGGGRAWVCTQRVSFPDGREFVGTGILPDVPVELDLATMTSGRDVTRAKGVEVLKGMMSAR